MKKRALGALAVMVCLLAPFWVLSPESSSPENDVAIEKSSVEFGQSRPFSFYYPYDYKFYTPRSRYYMNMGACYWVYKNGTYVYTCH